MPYHKACRVLRRHIPGTELREVRPEVRPKHSLQSGGGAHRTGEREESKKNAQKGGTVREHKQACQKTRPEYHLIVLQVTLVSAEILMTES